MEEKLIDLKERLLNKVFYHTDTSDWANRKTYFCKDIQVVSGKIKIICEGRTFVFVSEVVESAFLDKIRIESGVVLSSAESHLAEIMPAPGKMQKLTDSLYDMFDKVSSGAVGKAEIDKAKTLVSISNQIIGIEKIKLMQLNFKNK